MAFERIGPAANEAERIARLRLIRTPRIGPVHFSQLLHRFGSAARALDALPSLVQRNGGASLPPPQAMIDRELQRAEACGARLILIGDPDYPALLTQADGSPPVLWGIGPLRPHGKSIAMVGARNASAAGARMAAGLAKELGEAGFIVVSGLARGIDAKAHEAALTTGTVAVLGGAVDDVYPPENARLYDAVAERGLILSESPMGYTAQARDFPRRNRIISALALGTIVVEAELRSGSLITARLALEQNREVFAVPGSPLDPRTRGCNDLLRHGANLCENAEDVIRVLQGQFAGDVRGFEAPGRLPLFDSPPAAASVALPEDDIARLAKHLSALITATPVSRDDLVRLVNAPSPIVLAALGELEIAGIVAVEDGLYSRL